MLVRSAYMFLLVLGVATPACAQAGKPAKSAPAALPTTDTTALIRLLETRMETKDFSTLTSLHAVVELLQEKFAVTGKNVPVVINAQAWGREGINIDQEPLQVHLLTKAKRLSVHALLEQLTAQTFATYLVRQGGIDIVPAAYATIENLLTLPVLARYEQLPLPEVLQDLADQTGATIVLDTRVGESAKEAISATLRNNVTLEDALRMCTEAAGLKFVVLRNSIYVTTPSNAHAIRQEQQETPAPSPKKGGAAS